MIDWMITNPILSLLILLAQFTVMMKIHHKAHNKYLHMIMGAIFQPQNAVFNATVITVVGLELPKWKEKEWFTTFRMKRWQTLDPNSNILNWWRYTFSTFLCSLLNYSDTGHC